MRDTKFLDINDVTKLEKSGAMVYPPGKGMNVSDRGARATDEQNHYLRCRDFGTVELLDGRLALRDERPIPTENTTDHTGWHYHEGEFHIIACLKGENHLEFEDGVVHLVPGTFVQIPNRAPHRALYLSPDAEILELSVPAKIETFRCPSPKKEAAAT
jgi:hypothetical protein